MNLTLDSWAAVGQDGYMPIAAVEAQSLDSHSSDAGGKALDPDTAHLDSSDVKIGQAEILPHQCFPGFQIP